MARRKTVTIRGTVASGFERVREAFETNFATRNELGAACTVYHRGEPVVDLWGGHRDATVTKSWTENTLVLMFSATKGMAATAMALAHARGYFAYDDPIADHWDAFGRHGKRSITVRQLLGHRAGLAAVDETLTPAKIDDEEYLESLLAAKRPDWEPGARHGYHAFSLGWYESGLLRRTDPEGRSLGRFFAEEIADPLDLEWYVGLPDEVGAERLSRIDGIRPLDLLRHPRSVPPRMALALLNPRSITSRALNPFDLSRPSDLDAPAYRSVEIPAGNGIGRVRDVAKVYGLLATGGGELGVDEATYDELVAPAVPPSGGLRDAVLKTDTAYSLGYWKPCPALDFGSSHRSFGAPGAGGAFGFADPDRELGFAYAPNRLGTYLTNDPRERALRDAVYGCLE